MPFLKIFYNWLGVRHAPEGTLFHALDQMLWRFGLRVFGIPLPPSVKNLVSAEERPLAFWISGGIGDHLIAARYVRDLMVVLGDVPFHVYAQKVEIAKWIFSGFPSFKGCFDERYASHSTALSLYPFVWRLFTYIDIRNNKQPFQKNDSSVRQKIEVSIKNVQNYNAKIELLIRNHPSLDGYLGEVAVRRGLNRMTIQQGASAIPYGGHVLYIPTDQSALQKTHLTAGNYITLHNGFDAVESDRYSIKQSTKTYPHFAQVVALLRKNYPDLCVVQLGVQTSTLIEGVDVELIGKINLPECAEILRHSMLHIDGESGLVHLAACLGVKSCVVFGPTSADFFGYEQNINIRPGFCGNCWWMTEDWLKNCPRGFDEARCLSEQDPQIIADKILQELAQRMSAAVKASN